MRNSVNPSESGAEPRFLDVASAGVKTMTSAWEHALRCPRCYAQLERARDHLRCLGCAQRYPVVDGIPVLIDERESVFRIHEFVQREPTFFHTNPWLGKFRRLVPEPTLNVKSRRNFVHFADLLRERSAFPRILVIGGSVLGKGMEALVQPGFELVETDVSLGARTRLICDAHSIPFADATFDGVVAQAVLEHVVDPFRCVAEIHRVLKPDGVVYAETPFMQQVHGGAYDFLRFTRLGHLRLFRRFREVRSGSIGGPATALAWAWEYLLRALLPASLRNVGKAIARLTAWPLLQLDRWIENKPAAIDGASGYYFLGTRSEEVLADRELIGRYLGAS